MQNKIDSASLITSSDVNTQHIMLMIDKGIKKNMRLSTSSVGRLARKAYLRLKKIRILSFICLALISFFEKPHWCLADPDISGGNTCKSE
jgi:hypothetical protein